MWDVRNENDVYYRNDDMRIWESRSWIDKKTKNFRHCKINCNCKFKNCMFWMQNCNFAKIFFDSYYITYYFANKIVLHKEIIDLGSSDA